ncbi:MAG: hypothetical protein KDA88_22420 [Planctomycetaceae bacterium]|nr:hypothetical protein [Planctomycetaceae bacterium]MCB9952127.1 hypothetical protein [Planctomycetaceae bacterium]
MPRPKLLSDAAFQIASIKQQLKQCQHGSEVTEADRQRQEMTRRQIHEHLDGDEDKLALVLARADGESFARIIDNQNLAVSQDKVRRNYRKAIWQVRTGFVRQETIDKAKDGNGSMISVGTRDELPIDADAYLVSMCKFRQTRYDLPTAQMCDQVFQRTHELVCQGIKEKKFEPFLACWPWQGKWIVDIAFVVPDLEPAIEMAQSFNQPHILHLASRRLIAI